MYKSDLALNNIQRFIYHKTKRNKNATDDDDDDDTFSIFF